MTGKVTLAPRGRPPSFSAATPERLKPTRRADEKRGRDRGNNLTASSTTFLPNAFASTPFTPFPLRVPVLENPSCSGTHLPGSVVHEYIRRCVYNSRTDSRATSKFESRASKYAHEEKKIDTSRFATYGKNAPAGPLPSVSTAGERPPGRHTPRTGTKSGSAASLKPLAFAPGNPPQVDSVDISTLRSCILQNQRKLAELATELKRIATPYAVRELSAQMGDIDGRQAHRSTDQSAAEKKKSRFPSAPADSRPHADIPTRKGKRGCDTTSEFPVSRDTAGKRSQQASAVSQAHSRVDDGKPTTQTSASRSSSTPASFSWVGGAVKSRLLKPDVTPPQLAPTKLFNTSASPRCVHPGRGAKDISKILVRREPLSAKEVRKLVSAWKSADQQLKERMNFWVRDLPAEVRNRVRAASGVEKKFLALRDCVFLLWKASEERALAVLEMHQRMADCKECYQSQQGQVESALVGVQGGLLAASAKIKQVDRLIRLQTESRMSSKGENCCINFAAGYPFTPYNSVFASSARTQDTDYAHTEKVSTESSEGAANAAVVDRRGDRKPGGLTVETVEAEKPAATAAGQTLLRRTEASNTTSPAENVTHAATPTGAHDFITTSCRAPHSFSDRAVSRTTSKGESTQEFERVYNSHLDQCPSPGAVASFTPGVSFTPVAALASDYREQNTAALAFASETNRCPPTSRHAGSMRHSAPCCVGPDGFFTLQAVRGPYGCDGNVVSEETKMSYYCTATQTSNKNVSLGYEGMERNADHLPSGSGVEQNSKDGNSVGAVMWPPAEGVGRDVRSSEKQWYTKGHRTTGGGISPTFHISSLATSSCHFHPSAADDDKEAKISRFHSSEKTMKILAELSMPSGPYQLSRQPEVVHSPATEINGTLNSSHMEAHRGAHGALLGLFGDQKNCVTEDTLKRIRLSDDVSAHVDLYAHPSQHQADDSAVNKPPSTSLNEDVSWAADFVSRWRAQRRGKTS